MFKSVVLGLDGSDSSDRALDYVEGLAREHGSSVAVVHVVEMIAGRGAGTLHVDEDEVKAKIERQTAALVGAGIDAKLEVHSAMAGGPAHVIAEAAERLAADLIVTGTRGHSAAAGVFVGSVAQRLLHVARRPLLIIPAGVPWQPQPVAATADVELIP